MQSSGTVSGPGGRGFAVFRNRDFRLLWTGAVASNIGTWIQQIAQGWLVVTLTNSPAWLGAVALANSIPFLVLPIFGGVIADRVDRIWLLKITQAISMLLALVLGVLTLMGAVQVWQIMLIAFLNSVAASFDQPTRQALLPDLVSEQELMQALSLQSTAFQGAALIGPALAGVLVGLIGSGGCFMINAASFVFVILALYLMRVPPAEPKPRRAVAQEMTEGLRFVSRTPVILYVLLLTSCFSIFARSYSTLMPAFAKLDLHTSARTLGLMYAMPGLGTLVGGFTLALYGDVKNKGTLVAVTSMLTAGGVFAFAVSDHIPLILALLILVGVGTTCFNATVTAILQVRTPASLRGRVMSYNTIAWRGFTPLGGFVVGAIAEVLGTREAMALGGLVVLAATLVLYLLVPYIRQANTSGDTSDSRQFAR